jgi:hypothetical protein
MGEGEDIEGSAGAVCPPLAVHWQEVGNFHVPFFCFTSIFPCSFLPDMIASIRNCLRAV